MRTLLYTLFIEHWPRKLISLILAVVIWLVVNQTLTATRNFGAIPVRVINIPEGKTVEGIQPNGRLAKKIALTLVGNKTILDILTPYDLEVILDATHSPDEWIVNLSKGNLISINPEIDIHKAINRIHNTHFMIRTSKLVSEQIPIVITQPVGQAPRGYQFLDVWPYRLSLSVSGPEETIKRLKMKEQRITFNLNDITKAQLDNLANKSDPSYSGVISYYIPEQWKQINLPLLSDTPIPLDDPQIETLRIDFIRSNLMPINKPIPINLFFPAKTLDTLNPESIQLSTNELIQHINGVYALNMPLYVNGVDRLFLETVHNRIQIVIVAASPAERNLLEWSIEFVNPRQLEDTYVSTLMANISDQEAQLLHPAMREEYLRNRFRSYMNRFQLFQGDETQLSLSISLQENMIEVNPTSQ